MIGYMDIEGVDSWTIDYAWKTIQQFIHEKTGKNLGRLNLNLYNAKEKAMFEYACTIAFNYYDL